MNQICNRVKWNNEKIENLLNFIIKTKNENKYFRNYEHYFDEEEEYSIIVNNIMKRGKKNELQVEPDLLKIRERLFDWLIIVTSKLNFSLNSYFVITEIIDLMIRNSTFKKEELKLIAISSIFIISKYEELKPLTMTKLLCRVAYNVYSSGMIVNSELNILKALSYRIPTIFELDFFYLFIFKFSNSIFEINQLNELHLKERNSNLRRQNCVILASKNKEINHNLDMKSVIQIHNTLDETLLKNIVFLLTTSLYKLIKIYNYSGHFNNLLLYCSIIYFSYKLVYETFKIVLVFNIHVISEHFSYIGIDLKQVIDVGKDLENLICRYKVSCNLTYLEDCEILKYF